ncbi:MAG: hypothetical protein RLZZ601_1381 [Pseudomonadota bacterium]|jgi:hypothetical protein
MGPFSKMGGAGWVGVSFQEIRMGYPLENLIE